MSTPMIGLPALSQLRSSRLQPEVAPIEVPYDGREWTITITEKLEKPRGPLPMFHTVHIDLHNGTRAPNELMEALSEKFNPLFEKEGFRVAVGGKWFVLCSDHSQSSGQWLYKLPLLPDPNAPEAPPADPDAETVEFSVIPDRSRLPGGSSLAFLKLAFNSTIATVTSTDVVSLGGIEYQWYQDAAADKREGNRVEWRLGMMSTKAKLLESARGALKGGLH